MAFRSWVKLLATTAAAAAVVGAGQLGIAYGLGMVRLDLDLDVTLRDQWTAQLAWVAWITMTAAAFGAIVGTGLRPRWRPQQVGMGGALAMGMAGGLGALAVLPLTMQPARAALIDGVRPVFVIGVCAGLAAAVGIFAAWAAAAKAVARWNLATLTVLVWIVALVSVTPSLLPGRTPEAPRLGVLGGSLIPEAVADRTPFLTMPVLALLAGLILGWVARGRRKSTLAVALTGLAGPALLTVAYLIAGPGQDGAGFAFSPYWAAMIASGAGVLGSVLAAIVRGAPESSPAEELGRPGGSPSNSSAPPSSEPSTGNASLPQRHAPSQSAIAAVAAAAAQRPEAQLRPSDTGVFSVAERPHPLADLANNVPANAVGSPFSSGTGTPFTQQPEEPRFSGQQAPAAPAPNPRRGWRTRRSAPENPPAPAPSFNGFAAPQPAPRTGVDTAPAQRTPLTPDSILPPEGRDSEYVSWVNRLGNS
ncbi:hypothetical protein AB0M02_07940 [Actinoplanes sp. NPDC051861]|uniref:hypothetical protein n=1 Tax=Actinoplanes sp. NPDC051861 TaxID=3155170 RepID=UPI00343F7F50